MKKTFVLLLCLALLAINNFALAAEKKIPSAVQGSEGVPITDEETASIKGFMLLPQNAKKMVLKVENEKTMTFPAGVYWIFENGDGRVQAFRLEEGDGIVFRQGEYTIFFTLAKSR